MRKRSNFLKALLITPAILVFFTSNGQQNSLIPPSPEAASFFKSTDIPVSLYTGVPNIGVDFYTIRTKELQIPIRINYNARGIQVAEVASRTGIGWALQYGGMISRQIRGSADEESWGILSVNYYNEVFTSSPARGELNANIINHQIDEYPDQFYFDVNGENGKFTIDYNDSNVVLQKFNDIKIIPSYADGKISSWIVTDKLGNKYYYGRTKDGTRGAIESDWPVENYSFSDLYGMRQLGTSESRPNSAWHLMEIETYLHETIEFFYDLEEGIQYRRSYDKIQASESGTSTAGDAYFTPRYEECFFSNVHSHQYQISEIRFPGGKVIFESDTIERKDFRNTHALHSIAVKDERDSLVKRFDFDYFYQRCHDDDNQLFYLKQIDTAANYHLFLSSIKEKSNSEALPPYQFEYNSVLLPNRFSNSQDVWGYYNGKGNGPYLTFLTYNRLINRTVDTALSGAGLLTKMTYPTGGSVSFAYEQNRAITPPFMNDLIYNPINPVDTVYIGAALFRAPAYFSNGTYTKEFVIGTNILHLSTVSFSFVQPVGINSSNSNYQVILQRLDSAGAYYLYPPDTALQLNLVPGQYKLEVVPRNSLDTTGFIASVKWAAVIQHSNLDSGELYGGGKRIKRIEHSVAGKLVGVKEYKYLDTAGKTSGKVFGLPAFNSLNKTNGVSVMDGFGCVTGSPIALLQGNSIGYSRVTEFYGDSSQNQGKAVYEFTNDADGGTYYKYPYPIPIDFEWLRGKPLKTEIYKNNEGDYELQKTVQNTYLYAGLYHTPNIFSQPFINSDSVYTYRRDRNLYYLPLLTFSSPGTATTPPDYEIYYQSAGTVDLASSIEKEYVNGGELSKTTEYGYNYQKHYQQVIQKTFNSKGDSSIVTSFFPLDIDSRTVAEQKLVDFNRIAVPIKVEADVKNNSNIVVSKIIKNTVYKDWGSNLVLPEYLQSSVNNAPFENDVTYTKYNSIGSPLEVTSKAGVNELYIWGYKNQYPVAKIIGSDYNTVIDLIDTAIIENADQYSDAQIRSELNKVRTGLAGTMAQVFTYTYDPLIGMTSQTDANNRTTYYEYDGFGRLSLVRDQDYNILKKYCYNYAGQPEGCGMDMTPLWQSTGLTQCKPCPSNSNYLSNIQQHQEKDNNPYSISYNTYRWVDDGVSSSCVPQADWQQINLYCEQDASGQYTGNQIKVEQDKNPCSSTYNQTRNITTLNCATCPKPANWQSTGNYRCVQSGGVNTGAQEREEKDMESCSSSYNQLRWITNGTNCTSCPKPASWQATGNYRCVKDENNNNTGAQEREEMDMESCSSTYNQLRWVSNGTNCTTCPKPQQWQATGNYRCVKDASGNNTGAQEKEERNVESCSVDYNALRWVSNGTSCATCPKPANWQATGNYRCVKDASNNNTGAQEKEERDMESCSSTYYQLRWVSNGSNTTACPLPVACTTANCNSRGPAYKCVNGNCEQGYKVFTDSYYSSSAGGNVCIYHYEWSDGSWSQDYTQFSGLFSCNVGR